MATQDKARADLNEIPSCTTNHLADIIQWLKLGDYVIIHCNRTRGRFFHSNCSKETLTPDQTQAILDNTRVIYVNVSTTPGLLDEGEWEYYIKEEGFVGCRCSLKSRLSNHQDIPHVYDFIS